MKENHLLATSGGTFVIVLIAKKKRHLKQILRKERKKSFKQKLKERYEVGDLEVDLLGEPSGKFDYYVLYPRTKKRTLTSFPSCKENLNQHQKPPLIPYYQKVLP